MAYEPCVSCGQPFIGSTTYTYLTWWDGAEKFAFRYRQCQACVAQLRNQCLESADKRSPDGDWISASGSLCPRAPKSLYDEPERASGPQQVQIHHS